MKLTPLIWDWDTPGPQPGWLLDCPADRPVVWQVWLPGSASAAPFLLDSLSADERGRMARFHRRDDRLRFLTGRGLLRLLLGEQLDEPPDQVALCTGRFGKPALAARSGPQFNVSHSGQLVIIAFHPVLEVGVDVEKMRGDVDHDAVARRIFGTGEYLRWSRLEKEEQDAEFFRLWTRHEARLKARGVGFDLESVQQGTPPPCFEIDLPSGYIGAASLCAG
jgi:4'-phosphopantetheinyl transferase